MNQMQYYSAQQMRDIEEAAVRGGMTYAALMENAGCRAAEYLMKESVVSGGSSVLILCGKGNNGGDGYVMARCFAEAGKEIAVTVLAIGSTPQTDIASDAYKVAAACRTVQMAELKTSEDVQAYFNAMPLKPDVVIDAIYGIGFRGELPSLVKEVSQCVKRLNAVTVAIDIPSGMQADDGAADSLVLSADMTLTFTAQKRCMLFRDAANACGAVAVIPVGIPQEILDSFLSTYAVVTREIAAQGLPIRKQASHKGIYGNVYSLSGSYGMAGAAMLSGKAALRCGVGLLHLLIPKSIYPIVASQLWEAVCHPLDETADGGLAFASMKRILDSLYAKDKTALLCGPGLSRNRHTASFVRKLLSQISVPVVLDADGLNAFIGHIHELKAMSDKGVPVILTPHPAESARLLGCTVNEIEYDRIRSARQLVALTGATVVLKGYETIITGPDDRVFKNTTGCSGLATGGSGDVLAGMMAAFVAQGIDALQAAVTAVYLHGLVSLKTAQRLSETGMIPSDLLEDLPILLSQFEKRE